MFDWMDFNNDGEVEPIELMMAEDMLGVRERSTGGYIGGVVDDADCFEDDFTNDLSMAGLDEVELALMDEDERNEVLEEAGLDPYDYDFF